MRIAWLGLACAMLAGCGSDADRNGLYDIGRAAGGLVRDGLGQSGVLGARDLSATDAELRSVGKPLIKVTQAKIGLSAALTVSDAKGPAVIWRSEDGKTITLFNGLLIGTKGLGNDLSSARVPSVTAGQRDVLREHWYLGGDEVVRRSGYFCDFVDGPPERLNLSGVGVDATQIVETCAGEGERFENRYWFSSAGGILKSAQWAGPEIGMLVIEFVPQT